MTSQKKIVQDEKCETRGKTLDFYVHTEGKANFF